MQAVLVVMNKEIEVAKLQQSIGKQVDPIPATHSILT